MKTTISAYECDRCHRGQTEPIKSVIFRRTSDGGPMLDLCDECFDALYQFSQDIDVRLDPLGDKAPLNNIREVLRLQAEENRVRQEVQRVFDEAREEAEKEPRRGGLIIPERFQ